MKKFSFLLCAFLLTATLINAQTTTSSGSETTQTPQDITKVLQFNELDHDFGKIPYGKPVEYNVMIKNISNDSVKIANVQVGCGCTTPKWEAGPYAPGETFKVTLGFNGYTEGDFHKFVTIFFDGGLSQQVKFHGQTYKTPDSAAPANGAVQKLKPSGK